MYKPFMTGPKFLNRLRKDLNDPDFDVVDLRIPTDEEEYQQELAECQAIQEIIARRQKEAK